MIPGSSGSSVATISTASPAGPPATPQSRRSTKPNKTIPRSSRSWEPSRRFSPAKRLSPGRSAGCWSRTSAQIPTPTGTQQQRQQWHRRARAGSFADERRRHRRRFLRHLSRLFPGTGANPKYDFGAVTLVVANATGSAVIGPVDYADTDSGDRRGWIFDFDISSNAAAQASPAGSRRPIPPATRDRTAPCSRRRTTISSRTSRASTPSRHGPGDSFLNQGTNEPATLSVYHRGRELTAADCPPITVWQYRSVPIQSPGNVEAIATNFKPGQPLQVDTSQPGNFLFTFSIDDAAHPPPAGFPPKSYTTFMGPPFITNAPSISLRILPNDEDFSRYYVDPSASEPVGNEQLTFDVVYQKVLRTYYLLVPGHEFGIPAQFGGGGRQACPGHPPGDRSEAVDVESLHAAHARHVRQPPHAPPGVVPESPRWASRKDVGVDVRSRAPPCSARWCASVVRVQLRGDAMSYLDFPRLHFGGLFFTGPGTINNLTGNYTPTVQLESGGKYIPQVALWNPTGVAQWWLEACTVLSAVGPDAAPAGAGDPVIGAAVQTPSPQDSDERWSGRLLPPGADGRSRPGSARPERSLRHPHGRHPRERRRPDGGDDGSRVAAIESANTRRPMEAGPLSAIGWVTLQQVVWSGDLSGSPLLLALKDAGAEGLAVKFTADLHQNNPQNASTSGDLFCYGRVLGSIGPASAGELAQVVPGRCLQTVAGPHSVAMDQAVRHSSRRLQSRERVAKQAAALAEFRAAPSADLARPPRGLRPSR